MFVLPITVGACGVGCGLVAPTPKFTPTLARLCFTIKLMKYTTKQRRAGSGDELL